MHRIFYHKMDMDGKCSGAIAKIYFDELGEASYLYPYNYDMRFPIEEINKEVDKIYFLDVSTNPYSIVDDLINEGYDVTICDHHKSFIESGIPAKCSGNSYIEKAGCELTWHYFFPNDPCPEFVRLLGRYDMWDKYNEDWETKILPFQYSMKNRDSDLIHNFEIWRKLWTDRYEERLVVRIMDEGSVILDYQRRMHKNFLYAYGFAAVLEDYPDLKLICMNSPGGNSMMFDNQWDEEKYDAMFVWCQKADNIVCSLYTTKQIDLTKIACAYGGGGHAQACGFSIKKISVENGVIKFN